MEDNFKLSRVCWIVGSLLVASSVFIFGALPFFIIGLIKFFKTENNSPEDFYFNLIGIIAVSLYGIYYFVTLLGL